MIATIGKLTQAEKPYSIVDMMLVAVVTALGVGQWPTYPDSSSYAWGASLVCQILEGLFALYTLQTHDGVDR